MTLLEIKRNCLNPPAMDNAGKRILHKNTKALVSHKDVSPDDIYTLFRNCPTKTSKRLLAEELLSKYQISKEKLVYLCNQPVTKDLGLKAVAMLLSKKNVSINQIRGVSKRSTFKAVRIAAQRALLLLPSVTVEDKKYFIRYGETEELKILAGKDLPRTLC